MRTLPVVERIEIMDARIPPRVTEAIVNGFGTQLRHVLRRLLRSPMFTIVTVVTIAIAVGANSAIFSVVNGILLKPLPYPDPDMLVSVWQTAPGIGMKDLKASPSEYLTFREENRTFQSFGIWQGDGISVTGLAVPERVDAVDVTSGTLVALGVQPILGRLFEVKDEAQGNPETVILTHGYWQRKFGGDPSVIGRRIIANGTAREIVGVLPATFRFFEEKPGLILPFQFDRAKVFLGNFSYNGIARLKPGMTLAQANADVDRMIPMVSLKFQPPPGFSVKLFEDAHIRATLRPLKQDVIGDLGKVLWILMASIGVVLLIACANVANLLLVRAEGRQQELAIRTALGAGAGRIAREFLVESILLGLLGGVFGLGLAYAALRLLVKLAPAFLPRLESITIDPAVVLFTLAISVITGVIFGLMPVVRFAAPNVTTALRAGGRTLSQSKETHRARNTLVVAQVSLAMVLMISSGLMLRTFLALRHVDPGFTRPGDLQTVSIYTPDTQIKEPERVLRMQQEMLRRISAITGVSSAAFTNSVPTDGNNSTDVLYADDRKYAEGQIPPLRRFKFVAPGFFQTIGARMIAGRDIAWADLYDQRPVAIISENMARELWGQPASALGKRIREGMKDPWREIVGVVQDIRSDGADQKAPTTVYWPVMMKDFWGEEAFIQRRTVFAIRSTRAGSESFLKEVRQAIWSVNPDLPLANTQTLQEIYRGSMARSSFSLVMLAIAGGMALLLGVVGIYGVISYSVSQRTREMGIRIALGAEPNALTAMVVRHGVLLAAIGVAIGLVMATLVTRVMASMLFEIRPVDPVTYCAVSLGLLTASAVASYIPAYRASGINPIDALRAE